ncbi:MAG: S8 family serine peptidase, partial [Chloroflexota bacterium]
IIVGAGTSNVLHDRLDFSTYGSRVNVQGWGQNVFSLGYGDFANYAPGDEDGKQTYTNTFGGTSSASPFIAGAATGLQSLRVNRVQALAPLTSQQMRQLLIDTGIPQGAATSAQHIGPFPNVAKAILQLGIGATDCNANNLPDLCEGGGGCCVGGSCSVMTPTCCSSQGGTFLGTGFICGGDCNANGIDDDCEPALRGACCLTVSQCITTTECSCNGLSFWGPGTDCATTNCHLFPP